MNKDSTFLKRNAEKIVRDYHNGKSVPELAKEYGTYSQKIYRLIKANGGVIRSKGESQKLALETGRAVLPTLSIEYTEEKRIAMSEKMHEVHANLTDEQRKSRSDKNRAVYEARSEEYKKELHQKAREGILRASREGSRMEKYLFEELTKMGYSIVYHKQGYILNDNLEIDLLIPSMKVAVEVDGVYHTQNIHGELAKVTNKDNEKNGLLLSAGYVVIRLANTASTATPYYFRNRLKVLSEALLKIKGNFPPENERLIYLD